MDERAEVDDRLRRVEALAGPILGGLMTHLPIADEKGIERMVNHAVRAALATVQQIETMREDAYDEIFLAEKERNR